MDYKFKRENYDFWVSRIGSEDPVKVCTNDVGLDRLETCQILDRMTKGCRVLEVGCGNGLLYSELNKKYAPSKYIGFDFVGELITKCKELAPPNNHKFLQMDMTEIKPGTFTHEFDFIVSKRSFQNILDKEIQMHSIDQIGYHLAPGGIMILVESSATAQARLNELRKCHNLHLLEPPFHNLFFDDHEIQKHNFEHIELNKIDPFASDFYFITRLIYARYAKEHLHEKTHYEHPLEKIALSMAHHRLTSDFSQIQAYIFKKKM